MPADSGGPGGTACEEVGGVRLLGLLLAAAVCACTFANNDGGSGGGADGGGGGGESPDGRADGDACAEECERGCLAPPSGEGDAYCIDGDPGWPCESSEYEGEQYWTCDPAAGELHRCDGQGGMVVHCPDGCRVGALGTDDACRAPGGDSIDMPQIEFVISGDLFPESAVRGPVEEGVAYLLERLAAEVDVAPGAAVPDITVHYAPSGNSYCSGFARADSTDIECPIGYPVTGDNQNFVVNITIHEIGHIAAQALIAPPSARDNCENEGVATWMAGRYWMNYQSSPVPSLRAAARREIAAGRATATMSDCILASDPYYKVYGSFFEYLEGTPGAIEGVANGSVSSATYVEAWRAWLAE